MSGRYIWPRGLQIGLYRGITEVQADLWEERGAHIQAIDRLELKSDPRMFKKFAEKIRTHFFDLSRIGEVSSPDVIEKVCLRLSLHDRLAWNEGKWDDLDHRSLNDFGRWLCNRASSYQNAHSVAAEQMAPATKGNSFDIRRTARTHQRSATLPETKETRFNHPFCFKCKKGHRLTKCTDFTNLSIGESHHSLRPSPSLLLLLQPKALSQKLPEKESV